MRSFLLALLGSVCAGGSALEADDWPMWRYDARRSAATRNELPSDMQLTWTRQLPRLRPAWPDQAKMQLDASYEPIVLGQRLFVGSSFDDSMTAYDTRTGRELWRFVAEGPIRFAPVAWRDRVYFVSDDGYLYCLRADEGTLLWRFRGGPSDRKVLGNERLISTWPARGAPVLVEQTIYFAAGIWPFMGIFLHAVDARTGESVWTNDGDGSIYIKQPHNTDSFAGVAPQGPFVVEGNRLLIPGGRSVPACYDRSTGQLLHYRLADNGKRGGGSFVAAVDNLMFNGGGAFDLSTGSYLGAIGDAFTFSDGVFYESTGAKLKALELHSSAINTVESVDRKGQKVTSTRWSMHELSDVDAPRFQTLIKAGSRLYGGSDQLVLGVELPDDDDDDAKVVWQARLSSKVVSLVAADDRLFAVTIDGRIACFSEPVAGKKKPLFYGLPTASTAAANRGSSTADIAAALPFDLASRGGYGLVWSVGSGALIKQLLQYPSLRIVVVEPDREKATAFRDEMRSIGVSNDRVSLLNCEPRDVELPPYFASFVVAEELPEFARKSPAYFFEKSFQALRPFGGIARFRVAEEERTSVTSVVEPLVREPRLAGAAASVDGDWLTISRNGPLPGSANWTHEHADEANTRVSKDRRVKAPLGLLWFGGSTNDGILPRHGHGPQPQVVDGRLFIEGVDLLRAMDIYTGRVLWNATLPGVGGLYDNTAHQPGANASGTNFVATSEGVYVAYRDACLRLDPATGQTTGKYQLPPAKAGEVAPLWGYLNVVDEYLIGGAEPVFDPSFGKSVAAAKSDDDDAPAVTTALPAYKDNDNYSASMRLLVMDRKSGRVLWTRAARSGFRHNAICIGGGRMYCIDRLSGPQLSKLKRRGEEPPHPPRLVVFDLKTGDELWSTEDDIFGTWLSYSAERDVLVEAGRTARDTLSDEPKGMRAYQARDGKKLWTNMSFSGPAILHHDTILMANNACHLLTGAKQMREHPLSGESVEWTWSRNYGCNTPMASEYLMTFRSGAAGYLDLRTDGGTGNFGGFRSSCTNNLVVAGGLLTVPDYTRTCTCSYQNQASLALVPVDDVELWTSFGAQTPKQPIRRVGINLNAPGDRKADDGTLWLEYPSVGGSSPTVELTMVPEKPTWFRRHSSQVSGDGLPWVAASGAEGLSEIRVKLGTSAKQPRKYTLRLHFAEVRDAAPGERVFDVRVQGKLELPSLDVAREAGGKHRALVKEIRGVTVGDELSIELVPGTSSRHPTLLSGFQVQIEE